jgi:hypothetical protein
VTLTGVDLTGASSVTFGSLPASNVGVNPAGTQITATTPPGAPGPVTVTVTTPTGTASVLSAYTYLSPNFPVAGGTILASDTFAGRTTTGEWGTASDGHQWVVQSGTPSVQSVANDQGVVHGGDLMPTLLATLGPPAANAEVVDRTVSGDYTKDTGQILLGLTSPSDYYLAGLDSVLGVPALNIMKVSGGSENLVATVSFPVVKGVAYQQRAQITTASSTSTIRVRAWPDGTPEPAGWTLVYTDTHPLTAGLSGIAARDRGAGWAIDHFSVGDLTRVLGETASRQNGNGALAPTGLRDGSLALLAGMCYLLGLVVLKLSRRSKPRPGKRP